MLSNQHVIKEGYFLYAKNLPTELPGYSLACIMVHSTVGPRTVSFERVSFILETWGAFICGSAVEIL